MNLQKGGLVEKEEKEDNSSSSEFSGIGENIKERKALMEKIVETAPNVIIGVDLLDKIMIFNKAAVKTTGYSENEVLGKNFPSLLIPKDHQDYIKKRLHDSYDNKAIYTIEKPIITKNGDQRLLLWSCAQIYDSNNKIIGSIYMGNDITEKEIMLKEITRRNRELTALNSVGLALSQSLDLDITMQIALDRALDLLWSGGGVIFLLDDDNKTLSMKASKGINKKSREAFKSVELNFGILKDAVKSNNPLILGDFSLLQDKSQMILKEEKFNSIALFPLKAKSGVVGILIIGIRESKKFSSDDFRVLTTISNQIGIAVDNARLFKKVSEAHKEWENTFNSIEDPVAIVSKDSKILRVNAAFAKKMNTYPEEMIGKKYCVLFHNKDSPIQFCLHKNKHRLGKAFSEEVYDKSSGMTTLITCNPYHDTEGELNGTIIIVKDITENKEVENEISYLKDFNENIVENLGDGLEIIGADHKIQFMNSSFFYSVGKDVIGKTCYEMHFERNKPCEGCPIINGIENMKVSTIECTSQDGKTYLITHSPLKNQDGSFSAIQLFKDISNSKNMESELIKAEKMASIGSLISGIAHELNNPLAGIMGYAEATLDEEDLDRIRNYSRGIIDSATRVSDLLSWLVWYSQNPSDYEGKLFDLNDIIELSLGVMKRTKNFENVEVITDLRNIPKIRGNPDEIQQVFINLLQNSLDAMSGNGSISIETKRVNGSIQAIFKDSGIKISKENLGMIFDPFLSFKKKDIEPDQENWKKALGLFVTSTILKKHNAGVNVKSGPEEGTTFTINFPIKEPANLNA